MKRAGALLFLLTASACAYYNGLYNARGLVRRAEAAARDGRDSMATAAWREAAAKADTVIARYRRSRWTDDALLLSGTSAAFAGECLHGLERLAQWERHPDADRGRRPRASIARGVCLVRLGDAAGGLDTLAPFITHRDEALSRIAAAWGARAALATGYLDSATALARAARSDALDADLAATALALGRDSLAARFLRQRADAWRSLSAVHAPLALLAKSNRAVADSIVERSRGSRASRLERARLFAAAGAWAEAAGDARGARRNYHAALELSADTALVADVVTRIALLEVRAASAIDEAQTLLERARRRASATAELVRVDSALRFAARLAKTDDSTGASRFLAAEVARDAVGALQMARALFLDVRRDYPTSSLAPKALLAAASLSADSAEALRAQVLSEYGTSPYARILTGSTVTSDALEADERLLRRAWSRAAAAVDSGRVAAQRPLP